jgi:hypothetical protein
MSMASAVTDLATAIGTDIKGIRSTSGPRGALVLAGAHTFSDADHNKLALVDSITPVTLTFPATLTNGFSVTIWQVGVGSINFELEGRVVRSNASRIATAFNGDTVKVTVTSASVFATEFATPLNTLYRSNTAALSYTTATAAAWTSTFPDLVLEAGGVYDIDYRVTFQASVSTASLKLGFADAPGLTIVQLDWKVQQALDDVSAFRSGSILSNKTLAGSGSSAVANTPLLAQMTGRVIVGVNAVTLAPQLGANGTTGTVSVAAGSATVTARKVYGVPTVSVAYGPERVVNLPAWTKTNGVTVSGTKITAVAGGNMIFREGLLTPGKTYKVELDMTYTGGAEVRLVTTNPGSDEPGRIRWPVANGKLSGTFVATGTWLSLEARNANFTGTIDNWTVKELL